MPRRRQPRFMELFHFMEICLETGQLKKRGILPEVRILVNRLTKNFRSKPRVGVFYTSAAYIEEHDQDQYTVCVDKQESGVDRGNVNYNHRNMRVWVSILDADLQRVHLYAHQL